MRVCHIAQLGMAKPFYVYVDNIIEAKKVMDILSYYDFFQYNNNIKPDYSNASFVEIWDDCEKAWVNWYIEDENDYFDDIDDYIATLGKDTKSELDFLSKMLARQI